MGLYCITSKKRGRVEIIKNASEIMHFSDSIHHCFGTLNPLREVSERREGETRGGRRREMGGGGGGTGPQHCRSNSQRGECVIKLCVALLRTKINEIDASHCVMPQP